jgi:hypothetical protein
MAEYQPIAQKILSGMPEFFKNASPASVAAEVIFEAATDGKDQLRYTAGEDAKAIIAQRRELDDTTFMAGMKTQFGI